MQKGSRLHPEDLGKLGLPIKKEGDGPYDFHIMFETFRHFILSQA